MQRPETIIVQILPLKAEKASSLVQPTVLLTEPLTVRRLGDMTSGLLDQYQADVARGCNEGVCAQFYMERVLDCRREFWLAQLMGTTDRATTPLAPT
ncbi:hypothetical protein CDD83_1207 [Cordyceps sp. RAO-2017]|nr:hypothetical protein CDD83_1207 [Cordyceps sp. RAO-2017]